MRDKKKLGILSGFVPNIDILIVGCETACNLFYLFMKSEGLKIIC